MAQVLVAGEFGGKGELPTARQLESELPADWTIICNKQLVSPAGGSREIDLIILASNVVFVVEEKSWRGNIFGNDNGWVLRSGESYPSPVNTVEMLSKRIAGYLRDAIPALKQNQVQHFVYARVILSADDAKCAVRDQRIPIVVLRLTEAAEELRRFDKLHAGPQSIGPHRKAILDRLTGLTDKPKVPRVVGMFEVTESLPGYGVIRVLRARHADGSERILKLVQPPTTLDPDRRRTWVEASMREYSALQLIAKSGRAPSVDPYFMWDQDRVYVFPVHAVAGKTLRSDRTAAQPDGRKVHDVLLRAFEALVDVHAAGVVHRAITPDRVYVTLDGKVMFSDFAIARLDGRQTISDVGDELLPEDYYRAPECRVDLGFAVPASDVYGLAASLSYWATGAEPDETAIPVLHAAPIGWSESFFKLWSHTISPCLSTDERSRPTAKAIVDRILAAQKTEGERKPSASSGLTTGSIVDGRYRIVRELGAGATATTYLADDLVADMRVVLKRIRQPELVKRLGVREFQTLRKLRHPNLPEVIDVYGADSPFHLKLEYVRGSSLRDLGDHLRFNVAACVRIGVGVAAALSYLAENNLIHRDVSPGNILLPEDEATPVRLIDFGISTAANDRKTLVGTPLYRAPDVESGSSVWTPQADLYALGVVLFEALLGRLPYLHDGERANKAQQIVPSDDERERCGERLLAVLQRACHPDPGQRYLTAAAFAVALRSALETPVAVTVEGAALVNPFVDDLRRAYRNSRIGNADNRGLDSLFADSTYVPTGLDIELLPALTGEQGTPPWIAVLSGNPGDGKTAFLQRVRKRLTELGGTIAKESAAGWRIRLGTRTYAAVYDASESHEGQSADDLMDEALAPLAGSAHPTEEYTVAIAVNDGRLLAFFDANGKTRYPWLWDRLSKAIFRGGEQADGMILVDLKARALVGTVVSDRSLFGGILDQFTAQSRWSKCEQCSAREDCPIRFNALSFQQAPLRERATAALHRLFLITHLRRDRRATIRDVRSAMAYLITSDRGCADVHALRQSGGSPLNDRDWLYFNAAHNGRGSPDLLLDEWRSIDPAIVPSPRLDRFFWFHREAPHAPTLAKCFQPASHRPPIALPSPLDEDADWLASTKRRFFFEGRPDGLSWHKEPGTPPDTLIPYRYLDEFTSVLSKRVSDEESVSRLILGISRSDGVPSEACQGTLSLSTANGSDEELCVVKRFPKSQFAIQRTVVPTRFIEATADRLWLVHSPTGIRLAVGLDLFELLLRAADGLVPSADEQRALLEELATFKNHLLAQPTDEVALVEGGRRVHRVDVRDGVITLVGGKP